MDADYQGVKRSRLTDLLINNEEFEALLKAFETKIEITKTYLSEQDFVNQEIKRIKDVFIQPSIIVFNNGRVLGQFNYSSYQKRAYEWLLMGQNWELEDIFNGAKQSYLQSMPVGSFDRSSFEEAILQNIKRGVAYVLYEKFLKDRLAGMHHHITAAMKSTRLNKDRKKIPRKIIALLQKEISSNCPFCFNEDVDHFEIHHIDENRSNNEKENLLMLCPICHSKITKGDLERGDVMALKESLQNGNRK